MTAIIVWIFIHMIGFRELFRAPDKKEIHQQFSVKYG